MATWFQQRIAQRADAAHEIRVQREHILNVLLLGGLAAVIPYGLFSIFGRSVTPPLTNDTDILISGSCFVVLALAYGLSRWGWPRGGSMLLILLTVLLPSAYFYVYMDVNSPGVIFYALPIVAAGLLIGVRGSVIVAAIVALLYLGLSLYAYQVADKVIWPMNMLGVLLVVGLIVLTVWLYERETNRALTRLRQQAQDLQATDLEKGRLVEDLQALTAKQRELLDLVGELADPVIPVQEGVVVLPLIGHVDEGRASRAVAALLEGIAAHHARVAVVDVTGLPTVDTMLARSLVQMAQGARLLGAICVLSGLRAEVAQTLSQLDVDLDILGTSADVQSGIEHARQQIRDG